MPSLAKTRRLFASEDSNRLNAVAYWIIALLFAVPIYLGAAYVWAEFSQELSAAQEVDWISGRPPRGLQLDRDTQFPDLRKSLITRLRYSDGGPHTAPLVPADQVAPQTCGQGSFSFGIPENHVYPKCVSYAIPLTTTEFQSQQANGDTSVPGPRKDRRLTSAEQLVFQQFADFMTAKLKEVPPPSDDPEDYHVERRLAQALGLSNVLTSGKVLDVPWIYVASKEGPIAVFPGTNVIADTFDPKARPWYKAAFSGMKQLLSGVPDQHDGLSVTYLDVGAESSILVRTYLSTFSREGQDFVVGIDLTRRGESLGAYPGPAQSTWPSIPLAGRVCGALALSFAFFATLKWLSSVTVRVFYFERSKSLYGIVHPTDALQRTDTVSNSEKDSSSAGLDVKVKVLTAAARHDHTHERSRVESASRTAEASRRVSRGLEIWGVAYNARVSWHLFGLRFGSVARDELGKIQLTYTNAILPDTEWEEYQRGPFPVLKAEELKLKLAKVLQQNADATDDGRFEVPETFAVGLAVGLPKVPEFVAQAVPNSLELLALRQRRAYVSLTNNMLREVYDKAEEVRAIVLHTYFERILEQGRAEFLLKGRTVHRLISFPNVQAQLRLSEAARRTYIELLDAFSPPSRVLRRLNSPIEIDGPLAPVYDFALIRDGNGERVFVVHSVAETTVIDIASPTRRTQAFRVDGYLSWRTADVRFYKQLFEELADKSTPMPTELEAGIEADNPGSRQVAAVGQVR